MSFENIVIPGMLLADIYKDNLVELVEVQRKIDVISQPAAIATATFLGNNGRNILVLVHYPEVVYLPDDHLEFLNKILKACDLKMDDIAIINTAREPAHLENVAALNPKSVLIFGECISDMAHHSDGELFMPFLKAESSVIITPALESYCMNTPESKQLKSRLWISLQKFFGL
jgi:hypothetical protein